MTNILIAAVAYVAGIVSCAVWLKVTDRLVTKVKAKGDELRGDD